jgi:hypothetical protein
MISASLKTLSFPRLNKKYIENDLWPGGRSRVSLRSPS